MLGVLKDPELVMASLLKEDLTAWSEPYKTAVGELYGDFAERALGRFGAHSQQMMKVRLQNCPADRVSAFVRQGGWL